MRKILFVAFAAVFALSQIACQNKGVTTENGNRVIVHTKKDGPKADYGQSLMISVSTFVKDSMVQNTTRDFGGPREVQLPTKDQVKSKLPAVFEALLLMAEGDSATVYQPVDSMMAKVIKPKFGDVKEVRYEVVLVDILSTEDIQKRQADEQAKMEEQMKNAEGVKARGVEISSLVSKTLAEYKGKKLGDKLQKTASGLEYIVLEKGNGPALKDGDSVPTHYYGVLKSTGKMFDNSFDRGMPIPFTVGQLVPGFNEGMKALNKGGKAILFLPSALAYGPEGAGDDIPPNSDLVFYLEMEEK